MEMLADKIDELGMFSETLSQIDFFIPIKANPVENSLDYEVLYFEFKTNMNQKNIDYKFIFDSQTQHGLCFRISKPLFISTLFELFEKIEIKGGILFTEKKNSASELSFSKQKKINDSQSERNIKKTSGKKNKLLQKKRISEQESDKDIQKSSGKKKQIKKEEEKSIPNIRASLSKSDPLLNEQVMIFLIIKFNLINKY